MVQFLWITSLHCYVRTERTTKQSYLRSLFVRTKAYHMRVGINSSTSLYGVVNVVCVIECVSSTKSDLTGFLDLMFGFIIPLWLDFLLKMLVC